MKTVRASLSCLILLNIQSLMHASELTEHRFTFSEPAEDAVEGLEYLRYLPKDYDTEGDKQWPLVLFLHGKGESGDDLDKVKKHGPPKLVSQGKEFPFILIAPQCPRSRADKDYRTAWKPAELKKLALKSADELHVGPKRIYVTGLSMGGYGTWRLAAAEPDLFAAAIPICGGGDPKMMAESLANLPVWAFHGERDRAVPVEKSKEMVAAIRDAGGQEVQLTLYPEAAHDSWTQTYDNPEVWKWLLSHQRE